MPIRADLLKSIKTTMLKNKPVMAGSKQDDSKAIQSHIYELFVDKHNTVALVLNKIVAVDVVPLEHPRQTRIAGAGKYEVSVQRKSGEIESKVLGASAPNSEWMLNDEQMKDLNRGNLLREYKSIDAGRDFISLCTNFETIIHETGIQFTNWLSADTDFRDEFIRECRDKLKA